MAYVPQQIPQEEENKFAPNLQTTPNPIPPQGSGSAGSAVGGGKSAPGVGSSTQFGSNAAKLSDYLAANKDQAASFGGQVAGDLNNRYTQTMGAIDQGIGGFNQQVQQGYAQPDQSRINQAAENPASFASDPKNVSDFQSWYNNQYSGPQNFESTTPYSNINDQVNKAVQNASLVGSQAGLGTYLNNNLGANDTTEGMRTLDTALLMGNKDSASAIKNAAAPYQGLNGYLSTKTNAANANVATAKDQANQSRQSIQNKFAGPSGVIPTLQNDLNKRVADARQSISDKTSKEVTDFLNRSASPEELSDLGVPSGQQFLPSFDNTRNSLQQQYGINFDQSPYLIRNNPETAITGANVASTDDYARAAALSKLTGQDLNSFLDQGNIAQAGSAPSALARFDLPGASNAARQQLTESDRAYLQQNPLPSDDPSKMLLQRDIFARNPSIQQDPMWAKWYEKTKPPTIGIGPTPPPPTTGEPGQYGIWR